MREITTFTLLYNGEEGKQQDRIVKQFDKSHTVNLIVWMKLRMKFLICYRKYAPWLISAVRRIKGWQMLQQPSEIGVWESRAGSVGYLWRKQNWNDKISESCGHLQNHFNLLALFDCVSKYGTNENCLPVFTWILKTFSTGPKEECKQSGILLMRTSCHSKQTSCLSVWKNKYII